jgi:hypothetical protein
MGFTPSRYLYPRDPARRRLALANEAAQAKAAANAPKAKETALPVPFVAHPVKNAELAAVAICKPRPVANPEP